MKKIILILAALFYITQLPAQTHSVSAGVKNTNDKTVIQIPLQQMPGNETKLLSYNTNTTRVEISNLHNFDFSDTSLFYTNSNRWSTTFGTPSSHNSVYDIILDYDNGYYLIGRGEISGVGHGWNIKTDINGNLIWDKNMIGSGKFIVRAGCQDSYGNKYVAGAIFGDYDYWPFLVKFNACGEKQWCTIFKDWGYEWGDAIDILINDEGNIIVLSNMQDEDYENINQVFLLCYNTGGNLLWAVPYASKNDHPLINDIYCTKLYHFGEDYIISGYCYYPYPGNPTHVYLRPFFIGVDDEFNEKWILPFGVGDSIVGKAYSAIPLSDSVIMGVGNFRMEQSGYYGRSSAMMFFNHEGEELGYNVIERDSIIPGTLGNTLIEMEPINDSLFLANAVFGPSDFFNPFGDMVIDTSGKVYNAISRPNTTGFSSLIKTHDNKFVIACSIEENNPQYYDILLYKINANLEQDTLYTQTFVYDSLCPHTISSGDIDMSDCYIQVGLEETPTPQEYYASLDAIPIAAYPNPATNIIRFDYKNTEQHQNIILHCYNAMGQKMYTDEIISGQQGSKLEVSDWRSGIYIAIITSNGKLAGKVKFVVR